MDESRIIDKLKKTLKHLEEWNSSDEIVKQRVIRYIDHHVIKWYEDFSSNQIEKNSLDTSTD